MTDFYMDFNPSRKIAIRGAEIFDVSKFRKGEKSEKPKVEASLDIQQDKFLKESVVLDEQRDESKHTGMYETKLSGESKETSSLHSKIEKLEKQQNQSVPVKEQFPSTAECTSPISLTILHTNDLHGNLLPREDFADLRNPDQKIVVGGEAVIGAIINKEREMARMRNEGFIVLDSGDIAMGTPISGLFEGKPMIEVMNCQGYDAATIGNHDFDWGIKALQGMIQEAKFPFLASNIKDQDGQLLPNVKPFIIKELPGVKVGIVGVITPETKDINKVDEVRNLKFEDPVETLNAIIPEMKKQGADVIIVLSHIGLKSDMEVAQKVKGIDLIVGGHSHSTLEKPIQIGNTMIVQTGYGGRHVGKVSLQWDPKLKKVVKGEGKLILVDAEQNSPDEKISEIVNSYKDKLDSVMEAKLGESQVDMIQPHGRQETNLGNLITDIMRSVTGADIAMLNSGCIRTNLPRGEIKYKDIYNIIPFDSRIVTLTMKGSEILKVLEQSAAQEENDKFLQVSGLIVLYDSQRLPYTRIIDIRTPDGLPLDMSKEYTVATIDYLARGGDKYDIFTKSKDNGKEGEILHEAVAKQVTAMGAVSSVRGGRLRDIDGAEYCKL